VANNFVEKRTYHQTCQEEYFSDLNIKISDELVFKIYNSVDDFDFERNNLPFPEIDKH